MKATYSNIIYLPPASGGQVADTESEYRGRDGEHYNSSELAINSAVVLSVAVQAM